MTNEKNSEPEAVRVGDLSVGDAVVEADGYMWAVIKIERPRGFVVLTLANDFSPTHAWRSDRGVVVRKRASTLVACVRDAGSDVIGAERMTEIRRAAMSALANDPA